jgi:hypothetical protein
VGTRALGRPVAIGGRSPPHWNGRLTETKPWRCSGGTRGSLFQTTMTFVIRSEIALVILLAGCASAPPPAPVQRVFDVHLHAQSSEKSWTSMLDAMRHANVTNVVLIGSDEQLLANRSRIEGALPALLLPCEAGRMVNTGLPCFESGGEFPDIDRLRERLRAGDVKVLGEITAQYAGIAPDDPRLEPYFALAEELDIPVGIHLGLGPPAVSYEGSRGFPAHKSPNYSGDAGDPVKLERMLVRHPKLRLYVMHAAWPFLDRMMYMLYMHPQLYADISVLQYAIPRAEYYRYLQTLVGAGFAGRLMFGSDGGAKQLLEGVAAIQSAPFLSSEQKSAILYDNAAKFFRMK